MKLKRNNNNVNTNNVSIVNEEENNGDNSFEKRNDVIKSVIDIVEKGGVTRIASNLEQKLKEYEIHKKESIELEKRLNESIRQNSIKEKEMQIKTEMLSLELEKFIVKAKIIKDKNEEYEVKTKILKEDNLKKESDNISEIELFNEKLHQDLEIEEKFSKLNIASKNLGEMDSVDKELTSEMNIKENADFSGTATVVLDPEELVKYKQ